MAVCETCGKKIKFSEVYSWNGKEQCLECANKETNAKLAQKKSENNIKNQKDNVSTEISYNNEHKTENGFIFSTCLSNVTEISLINSVSVFGIGIITAWVYSMFSFLGIESHVMSKKMAKTIDSATEKLIYEAKSLGADGVMDVKYQMTALMVMAYGTAFKYND